MAVSPTHNILLQLAPFILLAVLLTMVYQARMNHGLEPLVDGDPYLHARVARSFAQRGIITRDHLLIGGISVPFTPYTALTILFSFILPDQTAAALAPILLAILTLACLNRLLRQLGRPLHERCIALGILTLTPTFIHDTLITGPRMAIAAFQIISATLLLDQRWISRLGGIAAGMLASTFSPVAALETIILGTILLLGKHTAWRWISALVLSSLLGASLIPSDYQSPLFPPFTSTFSDLGAPDGLATFIILLGIIGLWLLWPRKATAIAIITLLAGNLLDPRLLTGANIALACLSGATIMFLLQRTWRIKDLKHFALLVIACGILFSAVSATVRIANTGPHTDLMNDLLWLRGHSRSGEVVLSSPRNGHWIQYAAIRPVLLDNRVTGQRLEEAREIFASYNLNKVESYLRAGNVSYIIITNDTTNGDLWDQPNQGLQYLLANPETFKKTYERAGTEIYEYLNKPYSRRP